MSLKVLKFGGTSLGNIERICHVAKIIQTEISQGANIVVVVSAMANVTDELVSKAKQITGFNNDFNRSELDVVLSSGEIASAGLLALALEKYDIKAKSLQAWQVSIHTDCNYNDAKVESIDKVEINKCIGNDVVPIICGFQGIFENRITTLGRGGSDTTAIAIAATLGADVCEIYTDVEGVYSIDPNSYINARKINYISYDEMIDMAHAGAKVLNAIAAEMAKKSNVIVNVRSTFNNNIEGTMISNDTQSDTSDKPIALTCQKINKFQSNDEVINDKTPQIKLTFTRSKFMKNDFMIEKVFQIIKDQGIKILQSTISDNSLSLIIDESDCKHVQILHDLLIA